MGTSLALLIGGLVVFAVMHSLLVWPPLQRRLEARLGRANRAFRLLYNLLSVALLAGLWWWTRGPWPMLWNVDGIGRIALRCVQVGALGLFVWALRPLDLAEFAGLRRQPSGTPPASQPLLTRGAYAVCRHPIYLATCALFSAWPDMDLRLAVFAAWLWLYAGVGSVFEERKLAAVHGEAYRAYQARVPRLLPWPRGHRR